MQFHFTCWPDLGVPVTTTATRTLRNLVNEEHLKRNADGPIVVHCRSESLHHVKDSKFYKTSFGL